MHYFQVSQPEHSYMKGELNKPVSTMRLLGELRIFIKLYLCNSELRNIFPGAMEPYSTISAQRVCVIFKLPVITFLRSMICFAIIEQSWQNRIFFTWS